MSEKKVLIFQGGWDGHEPQLTSKRFAGLMEKHGYTVEIADTQEPLGDLEKLMGLDLIVACWTMGEIPHEYVQNIAKAVGVSRSHLYRVFMANVGQSPIDYLTDYRISEACYLLKNSHLSIAEIAVSVGFFDQFYFSRVFKKVKGVPPSRYLTALEKNPQL